jgi:hypothetical protein
MYQRIHPGVESERDVSDFVSQRRVQRIPVGGAGQPLIGGAHCPEQRHQGQDFDLASGSDW